MKQVKRLMAALVLCVGFAGAAWAQMGMGMRPPQIPGEFKPVVGSGAQYSMTMKNGKMDMAVAIVGKETVDGADGYWSETRILSGQGAGTIMKQLMVLSGGQPGIKRMIVQPAGRGPMEFPMGMMGAMGGGMGGRPAKSEGGTPQGKGEMLGSESVTVPAGTFDCEHYRSQSEHGNADVWFTTKVSPYGLVKMTSEDTSMVLEKVLTNEKSQITGEPQKMNFPGMPPR
jgi:hypothetical protein